MGRSHSAQGGRDPPRPRREARGTRRIQKGDAARRRRPRNSWPTLQPRGHRDRGAPAHPPRFFFGWLRAERSATPAIHQDACRVPGGLSGGCQPLLHQRVGQNRRRDFVWNLLSVEDMDKRACDAVAAGVVGLPHGWACGLQLNSRLQRKRGTQVGHPVSSGDALNLVQVTCRRGSLQIWPIYRSPRCRTRISFY